MTPLHPPHLSHRLWQRRQGQASKRASEQASKHASKQAGDASHPNARCSSHTLAYPPHVALPPPMKSRNHTESFPPQHAHAPSNGRNHPNRARKVPRVLLPEAGPSQRGVAVGWWPLGCGCWVVAVWFALRWMWFAALFTAPTPAHHIPPPHLLRNSALTSARSLSTACAPRSGACRSATRRSTCSATDRAPPPPPPSRPK